MILEFWDAEQKKSVPVSTDNPLPMAGGSSGGGENMRFISGTSDPTAGVGEPGDVYLNTTSGDLFKNNNGSWDLQMNLVGPQGEQGIQGPEGPEGPQGPAGNDGADGAPGFPTEAMWNDLVARVTALEGGG